ncbi:MAG: hypothetical protein IV100_08545 [Myxococcales bacterium]|nr:hypothetical protein [Myxococcales bacterium]
MTTLGYRALTVGLVLFSCSTEPRTRRDASGSSYGEYSGCLDGSGPTPCVPENSVIEIEDHPNNSTLAPCDTGTIKSPGADIDSAELNSGEYLTSCQLTGTTACESDSASASQAEGTPDATGKEETGTYTSLNGGLLRCRWSNGSVVTSSDNITVIEIGGTSGTNVEQYRIRLCDALAGGCQRNSAYASGEVSFSGSDLF